MRVLQTSPGYRARRRRSMYLAVAAMLMLAGTSAAIVQQLKWEHGISVTTDGSDIAIARPGDTNNSVDSARLKQTDGSARPGPRLMAQKDFYAADNTIPLGLQIGGEAAGLAVEITGLPAGTTLSLGRSTGKGTWRIMATDVGNAMIHPPPEFRGSFVFNAELRLADDTLIDRGTFRLEWMPAFALSLRLGSASNIDMLSDNAMENSSTSEPRLDREQIEFLIGRSQKLMTEGDFGAARTMLRRAAEARDARAALALGATFDPIMLAILQVHGITPDVSLACYWYKKARELGSKEAEQRLRLLAPRGGDKVSQVAVGHVRLSRFDSKSAANKAAIE